MMQTILLDTSTLLYWTLARSSLSSSAQQWIDEAETILVSAISIWEIGIKHKKGKLALPTDIHDFAERVGSIERVDILPVDLAVWLQNLALAWDHPDPADRTIVASAIIHGCQLITSDQKILSFYPDAHW